MIEENTSDQLDRFLFEDMPIRGERVLIEHVWQEILARRSYPKAVQDLLGKLVAITALLSATIKIEGKLTVQLEAEGVLRLLVVQINHHGGIRATASHGEVGTLQSLKELCGQGRLIITIDSPKFKEPYQGVIPLIDDSLEEMIERYFNTSEQLETQILLHINETKLGGLFLQRLPHEMEDKDGFNRVCQLAQSTTLEELLFLDTKTLLYRLYSMDDIRLFDGESLHFECNCSKERSLGIIQALDSDKSELNNILKEEGKISITCEFCGEEYIFYADDLHEQS